MAIAFDTNVAGGNTSGTSISWSHTCTGSNMLLVVYIDGDLSTNSDNLTGITYNGVGMTRLDMVAVIADRRQYAYYLLNAASGTHTVQASFSSSTACMGLSASWSGCSTTGLDATLTTTGGINTVTNSITSISDNCWHVGVAASGGNAVAGTGTTRRATDTSGFNGGGIFDNNAAITPPGNNDITATITGTIGLMGFTIAPFGTIVGGAVRHDLSLLGAGT